MNQKLDVLKKTITKILIVKICLPIMKKREEKENANKNQFIS